MDQSHIDALLARHLLLLDEYTQLRDRLAKLQSNMFYQLARANFETQRGFRYGSDQYDARMKASRQLQIFEDAEDGMTWTIGDAIPDAEPEKEEHEEEGEEVTSHDDKLAEELEGKLGISDDGVEAESEEPAPHAEQQRKLGDPLRWYGLFPPTSLRTAQSASREAVHEVIPRLVTVDAKMQRLEIEIRRARKKRAKTEEKKSKVKATKSAAVGASV
ncbi:Vacuolar ATPase assembly VMA22 [Emericellopsis cladophorae]|uniref:Vacuolar ATPase assembly protein VMA22 n=1 Tax=Emericellopsis cladophorae TaxID=2686198 RepID=A0A9P9XV58_9HYPO|nr:Vacuolar ATPase assembly VMA22 [Emericellopsis cladophorae]KAI6778391.1 Vacuolar ATPase assembly VMA22 [Emericellopsis cladophorae]